MMLYEEIVNVLNKSASINLYIDILGNIWSHPSAWWASSSHETDTNMKSYKDLKFVNQGEHGHLNEQKTYLHYSGIEICCTKLAQFINKVKQITTCFDNKVRSMALYIRFV